ncbi:hypothetical protein PYW08_006430 [Mythimna loreyi]|uniref:Uncharacterized protein n=1 Tax=Mythimna loreyi TaxID=667449 RepID=A0ACC2QN55_9NEOP|nr:hypothetical protein PYW08_006430 [Mythimna loreyi]
MWGQIYPHALFLIIVDIIIKVSCQGNGSITFLIDDTSSMDDDIKQVRKSVHRIKDIVLHEKSSLIDNMVLVTFNDPGVLERIVTKDPNEFKTALDAIKVHNEAKRPYLDCWEPSMKGLLLALKKSKNNSYVFVFTDAPAKDYIDSQSVIEMCQQKQTQIIFVLTGTLCSKFTYVPEAINSYYDIATACSGLAIVVQKNEVDKVFGPIEEIIKGNKTVITTATIPAGVSKNIKFTIDDYTDYVIIYSSGKNVSLNVFNNQRGISSKPIMWTDNVKVLKLTNVKPGPYVATVRGSSRTTIAIVGRTDFFFNHGFSEAKPKSLSDTSPQPLSDDTKVYLSISITDEKHSVKMVSAQLLDMDEKPILKPMPLTEISKDFYVTDQFMAPSQRFKVAVNGVANGRLITRISKIPVTPPPPKIAPKVQGLTTVKVNKGETVQIECKVVKGFPAPNISWLFENQSRSTFTPIAKAFDSVLVIKSVEYKDDGKYKCIAENVKGKDEHVTTLYVQDKPTIISSSSIVYESTEGDASLKIPCYATGLPKPSITWKLNNRVITRNAKYSFENGALVIIDPKLSDTNSYKCEAKNELGTVSAYFKANINQIPKVSGVAAKEVRIGLPTSIECTVIKGVPKPTITWEFKENFGSKFLKINGSEKILNILRVENKHAGSYKCVAQNKVGTDEHVTTLEVQDKPKIVSSVSTIYTSTEGDALLEIPCATTGAPKPSITWKLNGRIINLSAKYSIENGTLKIKDPKLSDTNFYTCEAKNKFGTVSATFKANIRQKPQVSGVPAKQVKVGSSASIECTVVKGEPKPTITWHFMDNSSAKFVSIAGSDKVLHISRVEFKHAGRYKCVAQNSVGSDEHITTLVVQEAPQVTGVAAKKVRIGSPTSIECTVVKGLPKPTMTWQFMDVSRAKFLSITGSDKELRIPRVEGRHAGRYKCMAQNSVGSDEHVTTLEVQDLPKIVTNVSIPYQSTEGDALMRIPCSATGLPKPSVTWTLNGHVIYPNGKYSVEDGTLIIRDPNVSDTNSYTCEARNEVGAVSATIKVDISQKPQVSGESDKKVKTGTATSIECKVNKGEPKPTITWQFMDKSSSSFTTTPGSERVLYISRVELKHAGKYKCVAQNKVGSDEHITTLEVQEAPQITGVAAKKVRIGSPTSIECTVVKGVPKPTVTWQFMIDSSAKFASITGSDKGLRISRVEGRHAGRYKCVAQNSVGSDEHVTTLEVQDLPKIVTNVSITYQSTEGDALMRIPCSATGLPKPSVTWTLNGRVINPNGKYSVDDGTLIIRDPKVSDTNSYTCEARNEVGAVSATIKVDISQKPQVSGESDKKVKTGTATSIECKVNKGEPKPTITWQFMDKSSSSFTTTPGSERVLYISRVELKHAGKYKCVAQNKVGSDEHITTLEVQEAPQVTGVVAKKVRIGSPTSIECTVVKGVPKPTVTWQFMNDSSAKFVSITGSDKGLRIPRVEGRHAGRYKCVAQNSVGSDEHVTTLEVQDLPKIVTNVSIPYQSTEGDALMRIPCSATGLPKPSVTWTLNGHVIYPNGKYSVEDGTLIIRDPNVSDTNSYTCEARNEVGAVSATIKVDISQKPQVSGESDKKVKTGTATSIECKVNKGEPKPTITWQFMDKSSSSFTTTPGSERVLYISRVELKHAGKYKCVAQNKVGSDEHITTLEVQEAPQVTGVAAKKVRIGSPTSIECTVVKGVPKPRVTWQFMIDSSAKFVSITGSDTGLRIPRVEGRHAGRYKCVAQNSVGSDEHVTTLEVQDLPKIVSSTSNVYHSIEGDALLRIPCTATGLPKPIITWQLNGHVINPSEKFSIEDGTLIIRTPKVSDTNSYTCEAKNEVGTVSATFQTYIRQAPILIGVQHTAKVKIGAATKITCTIKGEPKPTIKWEFMDKSSSKFLSIPGSSEELLISKVESKDAGQYKCLAENNVGSVEHITTLEVQDLPKIVSSVSTIFKSIEGDAVLKIPCAAVGLPVPRIIWKLGGIVINPSAKYSIEDGTLIIRDPKVSDSNSYTCEAENEAGAVSATFKADISQIPKLKGVASKNVRIGAPVNLDCIIYQGVPTPKISWQFMGKDSSKFEPIVGSENILSISNVENKHAGSYKCVAQNDVGSAEYVTTLIVQYLPEININSTTIEGILGDLALRIPCKVVGVPTPVITWKKNGNVITPSEKYSIQDGALVIMKPAASDSSSYTCEAMNSMGSTSAAFQATVRRYPKNFGTEHYVYLKEGETKKLECDAYTSKSQSIKWFVTKEDWLLSVSTTTPPTSDTETTTRSSEGFSVTIELNNTESYIQIASASAFDHDGNYTCHVSDKHGNTQTHTYVVDVGIAPKFIYDDNSLSNWRGDVTDIVQYCAINENAKPTPVVQWNYNGKALTDLNSAGVGYYTCNVSNVHGHVLKQFDVKSSACLITRHLQNSPYAPLILNEGFWNKLEMTKHYIIVEQEMEITLSCPRWKETSNSFKIFPEKSTLEAICYKEDSFMVDDKTYKFSDLQCTNSIEPSVIKTKTKCSTETSELIRVGYNVPAFLEAYEVCFDHKSNMPLYTRVLMTETNNNDPSGVYNWNSYPGIGSVKTERGFTCKDASSSCCYSKSQLVNAIDFNDGPAKKSTFIDPLNVVPVWIPCDTSKSPWEGINDMVRTQLPIYIDIVVWSGTHTLQQKNGAIIPRYLWKVVRLIDDEVMAIVHVNDPNPTKSDIKCNTPDHCDKYEEWFKSDDSNYCCSLPDFLKSFGFHDTDIGGKFITVVIGL